LARLKLDLHPSTGSLPWFVARVESFRDDAFEAEIADRTFNVFWRARQRLREQNVCPAYERLKDLASETQRFTSQVPIANTEHVEDVVDEGEVLGRGTMLQCLEGRPSVGTERYDLAIEDDMVGFH
jgi:hypothetical protein